MKRLLLFTAALLLPVFGLRAQDATFTITPASATYSSGGGSITFNVEISYADTIPTLDVRALALEFNGVPSGWTFGFAHGDNVPQVKPGAGQTGAYGFTYVDFPTSPALFSFTVEYPAGTTGSQTFSGIKGFFKKVSDSAIQEFTLPNIVLTPDSALPVISTHPVGQAAFTTQNIGLSVNTSTPGVTYQWKRNGANVPASNATGATSNTLTFTNLATSNAGTYTVDITNATGTTTSKSAVLSVSTSSVPAITTQPVSQTVTAGQNVTFTAAASGTPAPTFQWKKGGNDISGATSATLQLTGVTSADAGSYTVVATNFRGTATSNAATLTVNVAPSFTTQPPASRTVVAGNATTLTVAASGNPAPTYAWQIQEPGTTDWFGVGGGIGSGADTASLTINTTSSLNGWKFRCLATNSVGTATSTETLLDVQFAPSFFTQPASQTVNLGANVTFTAAASGNPAPAFQWRKDNVNVPGATGASLTLNNVSGANAGSYTVVATNGIGSAATSNAATLSLNPGISSFTPNTGSPGTSVVIAGAGFTGATAVKFNGVDAASFTIDSNFQITAVVPTFATTGAIAITPAAGATLTSAGNFTVGQGPRFTNAYSEFGASSGESAAFETFSIRGATSQQVLVRALGPHLGLIGVPGSMPDPILTIHDGTGAVVATNDDWGGSSTLAQAFAAVGALNLPANSKDSAILITLPPGTYTARAVDSGGASGVVGVEVFEYPTAGATDRIEYVSARGDFSRGGVNANGGHFKFILTGSGTSTVLIRGVSLGARVPGALLDPSISVLDMNASGAVLASNDNWTSTNVSQNTIAAVTSAAGAMPLSANDSALVLQLPAGVYQVRVSGPGSTSGVALVEAFIVDSSLPSAFAADLIAPLPNKAANLNESVTFAAPFIGKPAPTFQWQKDGTNLPSQTNSTLTLNNVTSANNGAYRVLMTNSTSTVTTASAQLDVNKSPQTITFPAIATKTFGTDTSFTLGATASSGLAVTYTTSNPSAGTVATISGSTVTIVNAGTITITASQTGNGDFQAAPDVTQTLTVSKGTATVALGNTSATYDGTPKAVSVTTTPAGLTTNVTYTPSGGSPTSTAPTNAGSYAVSAVVNDINYQGSASGTLTIAPAAQSISFATLADKTFGDADFSASASASSSLPVSFASNNNAVVTVNASTGLIHIVGAGTVAITASQAGNANYSAATSVQRTFTVAKAAATVALGNLAQTYNGASRVATATTTPPGLTVAFTYDSSSTAPINAGSYAVVGTIVDNNYQGSASGTLVVAQAPQTITFGVLNPVSFGAAPFALAATASSGLAVSYSSDNTSVASISGSTLTVAGAGSAVITAAQAGNANYLPATSVTQTLTVNKADQTIAFAALDAKTFGDAAFTLAATASSGLAVAFSSSNAAVATVSGSTVTIVGAGDTDIVATQTGNGNYNAAPAVTRTLHINKATATIALSNLNATYDGNPHPVTFATTPAGLSVGLTYNSSTDAPTNAGTYAVVATIHEANYQGTASANLIVAKASQTISFGTLADKTFGDADFTVTATATSTLPVSFASSNNAVATVNSATGLVHIVGAGSVTITASQAGNGNFEAATNVGRTFTVAKAAATVALGSLAQTYTGTARVATATTTPSGLTVAFTYDSSATAPTNAGSYAVVGTIVDNNYQGSASGTLVVAKADQTIAFAALPSRSIDQGAFTLVATASSGLPVGFASSATNVATVSGTTVTLVNTGTTTITASQPGDGNYNPAPSVDQALVVLNQSQTLTFAASELPNKTFGNAPFTITANSNRRLLITFTTSDANVATVGTGSLNATTGDTTATVTIVGGGTATITATQGGDANTAAAPSIPRTLTVGKASQTIAFTAPATKTFGDAPFALTATTDAIGLAPVLSIFSGPATIAGNTVTLTGAGSVVVRASEPGNANYNPATNVDRTITVAKSNQTIAFTLGSPVLNGSSPITLNGTATSALAVSYASSNTGVATVSGSTLTIRGVGTTTITASQAGNADYNAATDVARTLVVNPVAPVVTLPSATATAIIGSNFLYGPIGINALAQPVTFTMSGAPVGLSVNAASGNISGVPTSANTAPSYTITLTATNTTSTHSQSFTLTLQQPAPVITSPVAAGATAAASFSYTTVATPATGVTFSSPDLPGWLTLNPTSGLLSGTAPAAAGTVTVHLTATNSTAAATIPLVISIALPANAPVYAGPLNPSGTAGAPFTFTPNFGSGATTYALTGTLPAGITQALNFATTGTLSGTPTVAGVFPITISATRAGITTAANLDLTINPSASAPVITFPTGGNVRAATVGTAITNFQLGVTPALSTTFAIASGALPPGISLSASGLVSGTPTGAGTFTASIAATQGSLTGAAATLVFNVAPHAQAPIITSSVLVGGRVNESLPIYTLTNTPNLPGTTYAATGTLPTGLTFTGGTTGTLTGTPAVGTQGAYEIFVTGTNTNGTGPALKITLNIEPPNNVPVVTGNGSASAQVGQPFTYQISASNGPITGYGVSGTLPDGLTHTNGVISGVPSSTAGSPVSVALTATNASGTSAPKTLTLTISPAPATPVITSGTIVTGRVGVAFTYNVTATETPSSFVATNLPAGLTLAPGTGAITGSPTTSGTFSATLAAANAAGLGAATNVTFNIGAPLTAPSIKSAATATGQVGTAFTYQILAEPTPITSYAVAGALPLGLRLNSATGLINGSPTQAGTFTVQLTATGDGGTSLPQPLALTINPDPNVPVITSGTTAFGTAGADFNYTITATNLGSGPPYASSVTLDAVHLPAGLAVNTSTGVIQGRPTSVGTTVASLVATNASGTGPARDLAITVQPSLLAPVVGGSGSASAQVGVNFSYQIAATNAPSSYEVLNTPSWMTVDTTSGVIAGTPPNPPGSLIVQLIARNSAGASAAKPLTITIAPAPNTPVIGSVRAASGTVGVPFTAYQIGASVPTGAPPVTSYLAFGLPNGLSLNTATGQITGAPTPLVSGTFNVTLFAINSNGYSAPVTLVITIASSFTIGSGN